MPKRKPVTVNPPSWGETVVHHGPSEKLVPDLGKFDLILTDPPYAPGGGRAEWKATGAVSVALHYAARALKPNGVMAVFTAASGRGEGLIEGTVGTAINFSRLLCWHRENARSAAAGPFRWDIVPIRLYGRAVYGQAKTPGFFETKVQHKKETAHPGELPPDLCEWLTAGLDDGTPKRVLDPFCGSGSLLVPAARRGWEVVGIDKQEKWADAARARVQAAAVPSARRVAASVE